MFLDTYSDGGKVSSETVLDCSCSNIIKHPDLIMCRNQSMCYLNDPLNCTEPVHDESTGENYSQESCLDYTGSIY